MRYDFEQYGDKLIHRQRISDSKGKSLESSTDAKFNGPNNGNAHHREEYFATHAYLYGPAHRLREQAAQVGGRFAALIAQIVGVGDGGVAAMDAAGVTMHALSLTAPGIEQLDVEEAKSFARSTNEALTEGVRRYPTRFFGLAALPVADPPAA